MKSAEFWIEHGPKLYPTSGDFIKAIQSDAHQSGVLEGLNRAADIAIKQQTGNPATLSHYLRCEAAILADAEQIKSQGVKP